MGKKIKNYFTVSSLVDKDEKGGGGGKGRTRNCFISKIKKKNLFYLDKKVFLA